MGHLTLEDPILVGLLTFTVVNVRRGPGRQEKKRSGRQVI